MFESYQSYHRAHASYTPRKPHLRWRGPLPGETNEDFSADEPEWFKAHSFFRNELASTILVEDVATRTEAEVRKAERQSKGTEGGASQSPVRAAGSTKTGHIATRRLELTTEDFWDFLYSDRWGETCLLRVLEGELLDNLLAVFYLLQKDHDVITYATIAYLNNEYQEKKAPAMKPVKKAVHYDTVPDPPTAGVEQVLVELDYFSHQERPDSEVRQLYLDAYSEPEEEEDEVWPEQDSPLYSRSVSTAGGRTRGPSLFTPANSVVSSSPLYGDRAVTEGILPGHANRSASLPITPLARGLNTKRSQSLPGRPGIGGIKPPAAHKPSITFGPESAVTVCGAIKVLSSLTEKRRSTRSSSYAVETPAYRHSRGFPSVAEESSDTTTTISAAASKVLPASAEARKGGSVKVSFSHMTGVVPGMDASWPTLPPLTTKVHGGYQSQVHSSSSSLSSTEELATVSELPPVKCNMRGMKQPPPHPHCFKPYHMVREPLNIRRDRDASFLPPIQLSPVKSEEDLPMFFDLDRTSVRPSCKSITSDDFEMVAEDPFLELLPGKPAVEKGSFARQVRSRSKGGSVLRGTRSSVRDGHRPVAKVGARDDSDSSDKDDDEEVIQTSVNLDKIQRYQSDLKLWAADLHVSPEIGDDISAQTKLRQKKRERAAAVKSSGNKRKSVTFKTAEADTSLSADTLCAKLKHWEKCPTFAEFCDYLEEEMNKPPIGRKKQKQKHGKHRPKPPKKAAVPVQPAKIQTVKADSPPVKKKAKKKAPKSKNQPKKKAAAQPLNQKNVMTQAGLVSKKKEDWHLSVRFAYLAGGVCDSIWVRNALLRRRAKLLPTWEALHGIKTRKKSEEKPKSTEEMLTEKFSQARASSLGLLLQNLEAQGKKSGFKKGDDRGQGKASPSRGRSKASPNRGRSKASPNRGRSKASPNRGRSKATMGSEDAATDKKKSKRGRDKDHPDLIGQDGLFDILKLKPTHSFEKLYAHRQEEIGVKKYQDALQNFEREFERVAREERKRRGLRRNKINLQSECEEEKLNSDAVSSSVGAEPPPSAEVEKPMVLGKLRHFRFLEYRDHVPVPSSLTPQPQRTVMSIEEIRERLLQAMEGFVVRKERATTTRSFRSRVSVTFTRRRQKSKDGGSLLATDTDRVVDGVCNTLKESDHRHRSLVPC